MTDRCRYPDCRCPTESPCLQGLPMDTPPSVAEAVAVWPIQGVRVDGDKVVIAVKGGNDAARWLCREILTVREAAAGQPVATRAAMIQAPKRAYRLTLQLDADTQGDLVGALRNLACRIERDQVSTGVWGGPSDGAIYELLTDPAVTHEVYHEQVREYLRRSTAAREEAQG